MSDASPVTLSLLAAGPVSTLPCPVSHTAAFQPDHQNANIRRGHPRDAGCLTERRGANLHKLLPGLDSQTRDRRKIKRLGDLLILYTLELGDLILLAGNVAGILNSILDLGNYSI